MGEIGWLPASLIAAVVFRVGEAKPLTAAAIAGEDVLVGEECTPFNSGGDSASTIPSSLPCSLQSLLYSGSSWGIAIKPRRGTRCLRKGDVLASLRLGLFSETSWPLT